MASIKRASLDPLVINQYAVQSLLSSQIHANVCHVKVAVIFAHIEGSYNAPQNVKDLKILVGVVMVEGLHGGGMCSGSC